MDPDVKTTPCAISDLEPVSQLDPPPTRSQLVLRSGSGTPCWLRTDSECGYLHYVVFRHKPGVEEVKGNRGLQQRCVAKLHVLALNAKLTILSQEKAQSLGVRVGGLVKGAHVQSRVLSLAACQAVYAKDVQWRVTQRLASRRLALPKWKPPRRFTDCIRTLPTAGTCTSLSLTLRRPRLAVHWWVTFASPPRGRSHSARTPSLRSRCGLVLTAWRHPSHHDWCHAVGNHWILREMTSSQFPYFLHCVVRQRIHVPTSVPEAFG